MVNSVTRCTMNVAVGDLYLDPGQVDFTSGSCFTMLTAGDVVTMSVSSAPVYSDISTHMISLSGFLYSPISGPLVSIRSTIINSACF